MRTAVQHHVAHLLTGVIAVNEIDRMAVVQLNAVLVQLLRHGSDMIVQQGEIGEIVPPEMGAEQNGCGHVCPCRLLGSPFDPLQAVVIGPVQILPGHPPVDQPSVLFQIICHVRSPFLQISSSL